MVNFIEKNRQAIKKASAKAAAKKSGVKGKRVRDIEAQNPGRDKDDASDGDSVLEETKGCSACAVVWIVLTILAAVAIGWFVYRNGFGGLAKAKISGQDNERVIAPGQGKTFAPTKKKSSKKGQLFATAGSRQHNYTKCKPLRHAKVDAGGETLRRCFPNNTGKHIFLYMNRVRKYNEKMQDPNYSGGWHPIAESTGIDKFKHPPKHYQVTIHWEKHKYRFDAYYRPFVIGRKGQSHGDLRWPATDISFLVHDPEYGPVFVVKREEENGNIKKILESKSSYDMKYVGYDEKPDRSGFRALGLTFTRLKSKFPRKGDDAWGV